MAGGCQLGHRLVCSPRTGPPGFISSLMEVCTPFVACDIPDATELTVYIRAAPAAHEARLIGTRTRDALTAAKARCARLGSPLPMSDTDSVCFVNKPGGRRFANSTPGTRSTRSRFARIFIVLQTIQSEPV
ncbi:hypothetical protein GCM10010840_16650 [Deinococcus aerolatus]|uniref:Uncharacterized protein n=1 Tax=Deinococcus aerolatus TaxID=522487 RepID=A0ABQ2G7G0_9DEIO|nr:hypothetical protein GCM10010840_16650 [Deinococcus aerolatus]